MAKKHDNPPRAHGEFVTPKDPILPPEPRYGFIHPPVGWCLFAATIGSGTSRQAIVRLGRGAPMLTPDSFGGITLEPRPKRSALVGWNGGTPPGVEIPFTIGSYRSPDARTAEVTCNDLEVLAGRGGNRKPPLLLVHGAGAVPLDHREKPNWRWRIESLEFDRDRTSRDRIGQRIRTEGVVVVRCDVADETLAGLSPATQRNRENGGGRDHDRYTTKQGDTLRKIAKKFDLSRDALRDIKDATGIRDIDKEIKVGTVIRLPTQSATFG